MGTAGDTGERESHEPPVGQDLPKGITEASWWPFVTMLGLAGLYAGSGLFFLGHGSVALIPRWVGPLVVVGGALVSLTGAGGWVYHGFVSQYWRFDVASLDPATHRMGMVLFILTDVATFSAGFAYYFFIRVSAWPPNHLPQLLSPLLTANTAMLLTSSATFHLAHENLKRGNRPLFVTLLGATFALGTAFVLGQVKEYYDLVALEGFTITEGIFGSAFFGLTGLHGLHVTLGTVLVGILLVRALMGQFSAGRDTNVQTVLWYWHFIDAVWLFIVASVYVGATYS